MVSDRNRIKVDASEGEVDYGYCITIEGFPSFCALESPEPFSHRDSSQRNMRCSGKKTYYDILPTVFLYLPDVTRSPHLDGRMLKQ